MEVSKLFTRSNYLYNIVSIDNLNSILDYGILSKNRVDQHFNYTDISNASVQNIRDNIYITKNRMLHDFANLYFNPRNAMLYSRLSEINNLCILKVDKCVLDLPGTVVSDRNAAVGGARFMAPLQALKSLNFDVIYSKSWDLDDPQDKLKYKAFMMAEVLVYEKIPSFLIKEVWVANKIAYEKALTIKSNIQIVIKPTAFFQRKED